MRILLIFLLVFHGDLWSQKPEVVITSGHTDMITCMDFSKNGRWLATGSLDKLVKIIHSTTGKELRTFSGNDDRVEYVKFDEKAKVIGARLFSDEIKFWDMSSGDLLCSYPASTAISYEFDYVLNNSKVLFMGENHYPCLADFRKKSELKEFNNITGFARVKALNNGKEAIGYSYNGKIIQFSLETGEILRERQLFDSSKSVISLKRMDINHTGRFLAAAFNKNEIYIINTQDLSTYTIFKDHKSLIQDIKFDEKTATLLSLETNSSELFVWNLEEKKLEKKYSLVEGSMLKHYTWIEPHPKQEGILIADSKELKYIDRKTMRIVKTLQSSANKVVNMAYDQKGKYLAASSYSFPSIDTKLWDLEQNKIVKQFEGFWPLAIDPSGEYLVNRHNYMKMVVWDIETGEKKAELPTSGQLVQQITFSKDGSLLAGIGGGGKVLIWDMKTHQIKQTIQWPPGWGYGVCFSPDNQFIAASGSQMSFYVWNVETGEQVAYKDGFMSMISDLKFSPDGSWIAASNLDRKIYLFDTKTWEQTKVLEGHTNTILTIDISNDGKYLVSGAGNNTTYKADNTAIVWEVETSQIICRYTGHTNNINKVIFDKTSNLVYSCSDDGTIKAWDFKNCGEQGTFVSVNDLDYIITTPDFYYMASKDALDAVSFRIADNLYPFDQFDLMLNRPDIVSKRLGKTPEGLVNAYEYLYKKRLRKMNFTEEELVMDFKLPSLSVQTENIPLVTDQNKITLPIQASDDQHYLDRIQVYLNDVPLYGFDGISLKGKELHSIQKKVDISLIPETNKIQVSVLNAKGVESLRHTIFIERTKNENLEGSELYLVTIGVSQYKDDRFNLKYPEKDARDIVGTLSTANDLYSKVHYQSLSNEEVTLENIQALKDFLAQAKLEDAVIVFVAGHGVLDDNFEYYFGTYDINFDQPEKRGLAYDELDKLLINSKAIKKLLIMDTCHSGEVDKEEIETGNESVAQNDDIQFRNAGVGVRKKQSFGMENSVELLESMFSDVRKGSGAHVISSAGGGEYAMESDEWQNGLFTFCLLNGLKNQEANLNHDEGIVISELKKYVYQQVSTLSAGKQRPTAREENASMDYRVW